MAMKLVEQAKAMKRFEWLMAVVLTLFPFIVGSILGVASNSGTSYYYRPSFHPPNWLFGPMWTFLYLTMGFASFLVWKSAGGFTQESIIPLATYAVKLTANFIWSSLFFGTGLLCAALWDIAVCWALIIACMFCFYEHSKVAALLLVPYLIWVSLASALNYQIVVLTGCFSLDNCTNPEYC